MQIRRLIIQKYFNSHPHIEDDGHPDFSFTELKNFNSHPHIEDDYIGSC